MELEQTRNNPQEKREIVTNKNISNNLKTVRVSNHYVVGEVDSIIIDETNKEVHVSEVIFSTKSRTHWHTHPTTQIIIGKSGLGFVQSLGSPPILVYPKDVIIVPPNEIHWHGAGYNEKFMHTTIQIIDDQGDVIRPLSIDEYNQIKNIKNYAFC